MQYFSGSLSRDESTMPRETKRSWRRARERRKALSAYLSQKKREEGERRSKSWANIFWAALGSPPFGRSARSCMGQPTIPPRMGLLFRPCPPPLGGALPKKSVSPLLRRGGLRQRGARRGDVGSGEGEDGGTAQESVRRG